MRGDRSTVAVVLHKQIQATVHGQFIKVNVNGDGRQMTCFSHRTMATSNMRTDAMIWRTIKCVSPDCERGERGVRGGGEMGANCVKNLVDVNKT